MRQLKVLLVFFGFVFCFYLSLRKLDNTNFKVSGGGWKKIVLFWIILWQFFFFFFLSWLLSFYDTLPAADMKSIKINEEKKEKERKWRAYQHSIKMEKQNTWPITNQSNWRFVFCYVMGVEEKEEEYQPMKHCVRNN